MTTVKIKPTDTIRNSTTTEKSEIKFQGRQWPSTRNPILRIAVLRQVTEEQSFQQRYVERRSLKPGARTLLWLGGTALASGGYFYFYQQGYVALGRDLMGLGALIPVGSEILTGSVESGEQWKPESKTLPPRSVPARAIPLLVAAAGSTWTDTTDSQGVVTVDISGLADMAPPGRLLEIKLALQEDSTQTAAFAIPPDVVAFYRTPSPATAPEIKVAGVEPATTPIIDEKSTLTLAILDFEGLGISEQEARVLTNRLGTHMVQLGTFKIIERGQMQQILKEQDFQMTGCTSNECAVDIGQMIGAQQMLAGSFGKFGSIYTIDMRIIDVATGGILQTTSYDVQGEAELLLTEGLAEAARRIAGID